MELYAHNQDDETEVFIYGGDDMPTFESLKETFVRETGRSITIIDGLPTSQLASEARAKRDKLLVDELDPIVTNPLRWAELTTEKQNEWTSYRTSLLNVPQQSDFPQTISWPSKPE